MSVALVLNLLLRIPAFARATRYQTLGTGDRARALAIGALLFAPAHTLYYLGLTRGASTVGGTVLNATAPIWVAALSFIVLRERATPRRLIAIMLGFAGAWIVLFGNQLPSFGGDAQGNMFYIAGVVCESLASVVGATIIRRSSGIGYLSWEVMGMVPTLLLVPILTQGAMPIGFGALDASALLAVSYLVFLPGLVCFGVWNATVERAPLSAMVVTIMLQPPLAAFLAWWLRGEAIGPAVIVGSGLILAGLGVVAGEKGPQEAGDSTPVEPPVRTS